MPLEPGLLKRGYVNVSVLLLLQPLAFSQIARAAEPVGPMLFK